MLIVGEAARAQYRSLSELDSELADELSEFYADPLGYVMFSFPWETEPILQVVEMPEKYQDMFRCKWGPDAWAIDFLEELGADIRARAFDGRTPVKPIKKAISSGHGTGKSALTGMLVNFIKDTRPDSMGTVTAAKAEQLRTKTWSQIGKWHKLALTAHWFNFSTGRGSMSLVHKRYPETWRVDAHTCREENSEAFAGQHSVTSTSYYIFDESAGIPNKISEVAEGGLTDGEPMLFKFGNMTQNSGQFFEDCFGGQRHRYSVRCIDSRQVQITNKEQIQEWIDDYGEDSDFVRVRVRGLPPRMGSLQFISTEAVQKAMERPIIKNPYAPLVFGVDVARHGPDDSVIFPRIGDDARTWPARRYPEELTGPELARLVIEYMNQFKAIGMPTSAIFVDATGLGWSCIDHLRFLGYKQVVAVEFGKTSPDPSCRYVVDHMYNKMKKAIGENLALPGIGDQHATDLQRQLTQREFGYTLRTNQIQLESKQAMKDRLGLGKDGSPDLTDALALTFYEDVAPLTEAFGGRKTGKDQTTHDYNPHDYDPAKGC